MSDITEETGSPFNFIEIHDTDELRRVLRSMGITPADERPDSQIPSEGEADR